MAVIVLTLISVISCGKVTQEVAMKDIVDSDVFTLTYSLEVFPTESIKTFVKMDSQFPSQNVFTVADDTVFVWVGGINEGQWDTLSWGRAVLSKKDSSTTGLLGTTLVRATQNVTANVSTLIQYDASVFNRSGIRVKGSEYSESFLTFKQGEKSYSWYGTSVKIKRGYGLYMVALYSNKNKFYMKAFSESVASSNMTVALNKLMKHDTFMTSLLLMDMAREGILETPRNFEDAESLFSSGFTSALPYKFPKNTIKETHNLFLIQRLKINCSLFIIK